MMSFSSLCRVSSSHSDGVMITFILSLITTEMGYEGPHWPYIVYFMFKFVMYKLVKLINGRQTIYCRLTYRHIILGIRHRYELVAIIFHAG